jgi:nucleotide-binding universal stress UspA family protein
MSNPLKRILVAVDFHVPSRAALALAHDLAKPLGASIDVLHVVDLPGEHGLASEGYVPVPDDYRLAVQRQITDRLKEWLATTAAPAGVSQHVIEGKPAVEIVRYASEHRIDLIVMGTHGRGGVSHLLTGSVAENVVRTAHCPVVTVRGPQPAA